MDPELEGLVNVTKIMMEVALYSIPMDVRTKKKMFTKYLQHGSPLTEDDIEKRNFYFANSEGSPFIEQVVNHRNAATCQVSKSFKLEPLIPWHNQATLTTAFTSEQASVFILRATL